MSISTPSQHTPLSFARYTATKDAFASEWKDLFGEQNYAWSIHIGRFDGHVFDPVWDTTSGSFTTVDDGADSRDLGDLKMETRLRRPNVESNFLFHLEAFIRDLDLEVTTERVDEGGTTKLDQTTISETAGTPSWVSHDVTLTDAESSVGGTASSEAQIIRITLRAKTNATTGKLFQVDAWEAVAQARSTIP